MRLNQNSLRSSSLRGNCGKAKIAPRYLALYEDPSSAYETQLVLKYLAIGLNGRDERWRSLPQCR